MAPRPVWHLHGSPLTPLPAGPPPEFEPRPVLAATPPARADEDGVLVVDLGGEVPGAAEAAALRLGVPVVALLEPGAADVPPLDCHAYLQKPVTPFVLANALRFASEHARLSREHAATRRQLVELNAIGVRLTAERDTDVLLDLILTKAREITPSDAGPLYLF